MTFCLWLSSLNASTLHAFTLHTYDPLAAVPPVPSPGWLIDILHGATFVLHTAAMNVMVACAFAIALSRPRKGNDASAGVVARLGASTLPVIMSLTITLGVAPLLFMQLVHGERFYASSICLAWPWIYSLFVLMLAYYAAYACEARRQQSRTFHPLVRWMPLLGLLVFSFVLSSNIALSERPEVVDALVASGERPGWILALSETRAPLRWAHQIVGAVALGSIWFLVFGVYRSHACDEASSNNDARSLATYGGVVLVAATLVSGALGMTKHFGQGTDNSSYSPGPMLYVAMSIALTTPVLGWLSARRLSRVLVVATAVFGVLTIAVNAYLRFQRRIAHLASQSVDLPETTDDQGAFAFFALCFVAALIALGWLVRVSLRARDGAVDDVTSAGDAS